MSASLEYTRKLFKFMVENTRDDHFHTLGIQLTSVDKGRATLALPYSDEIVGNPETGVVHGGVLTALLDTCCGFAASSVLDEPGLCPTLDLRIDYMGSATPGQTLYAEAKAYRVTRNVIFCRAKAYQNPSNQVEPRQIVAHCVANFARLDPEVSRKMSAQIKPLLDAWEG